MHLSTYSHICTYTYAHAHTHTRTVTVLTSAGIHSYTQHTCPRTLAHIPSHMHAQPMPQLMACLQNPILRAGSPVHLNRRKSLDHTLIYSDAGPSSTACLVSLKLMPLAFLGVRLSLALRPWNLRNFALRAPEACSLSPQPSALGLTLLPPGATFPMASLLHISGFAFLPLPCPPGKLRLVPAPLAGQ